MQNTEKFDQWAIVELFGHTRIAGRVSEQTIGGCAFVRVDVPAFEQVGSVAATQAFTKLYGQGAIYAISFVDEAAAKLVGRQLRVQPIDTYSLRQAMQELTAIGNAPTHPDPVDDDHPW